MVSVVAATYCGYFYFQLVTSHSKLIMRKIKSHWEHVLYIMFFFGVFILIFILIACLSQNSNISILIGFIIGYFIFILLIAIDYFKKTSCLFEN